MIVTGSNLHLLPQRLVVYLLLFSPLLGSLLCAPQEVALPHFSSNNHILPIVHVLVYAIGNSWFSSLTWSINIVFLRALANSVAYSRKNGSSSDDPRSLLSWLALRSLLHTFPDCFFDISSLYLSSPGSYLTKPFHCVCFLLFINILQF